MNKDFLNNKLEQLYKINNTLRNKYTGLYVAATGEEYNKYTWTRDVYYQAKPTLKKEPDAYIQTYRSLLDYFKGLNYKYDDKVNELIRKPFPINNVRFIHPRFYPNLKEITGDWGNVQLDTFGYFFLGLSEGTKAGLEIIRDKSDEEIINKLVKVLSKINFWELVDCGIWEENVELHASSIGAVLSGLLALEEIDIAVPRKLIYNAKKQLKDMLPRESITKDVDLALLTLVYPFNVMDKEIKMLVLEGVHDKLERENGVARYVNDKYYNINGEAEWTFGYSFLFFSYIDEDFDKAEYYIKKIISTMDEEGRIPELFFAKTKDPNVNNPLGWSVAMAILAIERYIEEIEKKNI